MRCGQHETGRSRKSLNPDQGQIQLKIKDIFGRPTTFVLETRTWLKAVPVIRSGTVEYYIIHNSIYGKWCNPNGDVSSNTLNDPKHDVGYR
jgi:hypothetical protein